MVHGFCGYGEGDLLNKVLPYYGFRMDRNVVKAARSMGFEVYSPSVGPFNAMWDRACDLYAQLVGGTVDYGKVHSEKYGHKRYGNTYDKPLVPDWGKLDEEGKRQKVNLIGHSFGGPTVRLLIELLTNGSEEERAGTPEDELSDLFKGGHADWVHTCTVLACCNGVPLADAFNDSPKLYNGVLTFLAAVLLAVGNTPFIRVIDFKMPQWGITDADYKGTLKGTKCNLDPEHWKALSYFLSAREDNISDQMGLDMCTQLTKDFSPKSNIYYFSYAGDTTEPIPGAKERRAIPGTFPFLALMANVEGRFLRPEKGIDGEEWFPNDGLVNLLTTRHPRGEAFQDYDGEENIEPGIWIQMPVEQKHHFSYMGVNETVFEYYSFFYEIFKRACTLPPIEG